MNKIYFLVAKVHCPRKKVEHPISECVGCMCFITRSVGGSDVAVLCGYESDYKGGKFAHD